MENVAFYIYFLQSQQWDWKSVGWLFALFSGFGVKIAMDVAERSKKGEAIKKTYWIESGCGIFITFVLGYHSRAIVRDFTASADIQAGIFALIGVLGFTLFKILYKIITNPKLWERVVDAFVNIFLSKYARKNNVEVEVEVKEISNEESSGTH